MQDQPLAERIHEHLIEAASQMGDQFSTFGYPTGISKLAQVNLASESAVIQGDRLKVIQRCEEIWVLDISGHGNTGIGPSGGKADLNIGRFQCEDIGYLPPVIFLATPLSERPVFLTASIELLDDDIYYFKRLVAHVFGWTPDGKSAPNVRFSWRCQVKTETRIT